MRKIILLTVLALSINALAQKNCKYVTNKTDEFTKKRTVRTESQTLFENKAGAFWNSALFNEEGTKVEFIVLADYNDGTRSLLFILDESNNAKHTEDYSVIEFLLTTDSVITFYKPSGEGYKFKETYLYWRFYDLSDSQWNTLKVTPIKKIRLHYEDNTQGDIAINKKYANSISNVINCLDDLNLPITQVQEKVENNETKTNLKEVTKTETLQPTNDTIGISIYKQWKIKVMIKKDGIPINNIGDHFTQFNKDGTYTSIDFDENNKKHEHKGKFELMNDNKIIIFYQEGGKSSSAAIIKLSNKELNLKGEVETYLGVY